MKKFFNLLMVMMIFVYCVNAETVTIMHVNDSHGCLSADAPRDDAGVPQAGGIARVATIVGMEKYLNPNAIALHGGDYFIGDLFFNRYLGATELYLLKSIGFDGMVLGNHEFDLTPYYLQMSLQNGFYDGSFPIVSANAITDAASDYLKDVIQPYFFKDLPNGVRVGIFGLTTPEANMISQPAPISISDKLGLISYQTIMEMKEAGADIIVLLSHLGNKYDVMLAQNVPGIDIIIGAHDHLNFEQMEIVTNPMGGNTYIAQAGFHYHNVGKFTIEYDSEYEKILDVSWENLEVNPTIPEEPTVAYYVSYFQSEIEGSWGLPFYSTPVAYCMDNMTELPRDLSKPGSKSTDVGNLVTDAYLAWGGTDIAVQPCGSTVQPFYRGQIYLDDIFRVVGYGFNGSNYLGYQMATFKINGGVLKEGITYVLSTLGSLGDEFMIQCAGMKYKATFDEKDGSLLDLDIRIGDRPLDVTKDYTVTANELVTKMFDMLGFPISDVSVLEGVTEFEVLAGYIIGQGMIGPIDDGRIIFTYQKAKEKKDKKNSTVQFNPFPCNDKTEATVLIKNPGNYSLSLYDTYGTLVGVLFNGQLDKGTHKFNIDVLSYLPGTYYYKLTGGEDACSGILIISR